MKYSIVDDKIACMLRNSFIKTYLNYSTEYYHKYIESPSKYEEGMFYDGYLWDCLKENSQYEHCCSMKTALSYLSQKDHVYVMWDLFSNKRVYDGRRFSKDLPKNTIVKLSGSELSVQLNYEWCADWNEEGLLFPKDVYCFDEEMNWCAVLTHETFDDDYSLENRICFLYTESI